MFVQSLRRAFRDTQRLAAELILKGNLQVGFVTGFYVMQQAHFKAGDLTTHLYLQSVVRTHFLPVLILLFQPQSKLPFWHH